LQDLVDVEQKAKAILKEKIISTVSEFIFPSLVSDQVVSHNIKE